ncbi:SCP-2 sterol transfer family protein [Paraperlucidibaca baekdonensis]|uniref:SCP-2 sterol transfer family protein n=1 Tax=Paraperlucidibaca baekdonensis TaxID=748120 RepID=A0A3E0H3V3_9GAMM|nr:SCP2 sterol-binding domain-containing protein [Paraperlucidibaca baekdonensis]REH37948.1 SCP-2 sterol transfer family protein [Paraperlucidibaca baekdonensis]
MTDNNNSSTHFDDADHTDTPPRLITELSLGVVESLLNACIEHDDTTRRQVLSREGLVVRVKTSDPALTAYLLFTAQGIEVSSRSPGRASVRINASLLSLLGVLTGQQRLDNPGRIRLWGDSDAVNWLVELLQEANVRSLFTRWLREHLNIQELWQKIRRHDPSWISDLMPMPGMLREALSEIRDLKQALAAQEAAWAAREAAWAKQKRWDMLSVAVVLLALLATLLPGDTLGARLAGLGHSELMAIALGIALVCSRAWRR